jgi:hypothetical protein
MPKSSSSNKKLVNLEPLASDAYASHAYHIKVVLPVDGWHLKNGTKIIEGSSRR